MPPPARLADKTGLQEVPTEKFVFFDHAKNMSIAHRSLMIGTLLTVICGLRAMIHTMQLCRASPTAPPKASCRSDHGIHSWYQA